MDKNKKVAIATMLCSMLSVQGGASIAKRLFHLLGPAGATTLRIGLAGIILAIIIRPKVWKFTGKEWLYALFYGLSIGAMNICFYYGIQRVPLGLGATVEFIGPLSLAFLTSRKTLDFLWASLAAAGIVLILPWANDAEAVDPIGLFFVFIAGVMWAGYIVAGSKITQKMKSTDAVSTGMCIAMFFVLPFGIFSGELNNLNVNIFLLGLGIAVFSSALPFTLDLFVLKRISKKSYSVLQSLQPVFAAFSGLIFVGEYLSFTQWLAVLFVVVASMGTTIFAEEKSIA